MTFGDNPLTSVCDGLIRVEDCVNACESVTLPYYASLIVPVGIGIILILILMFTKNKDLDKSWIITFISIMVISVLIYISKFYWLNP